MVSPRNIQFRHHLRMPHAQAGVAPQLALITKPPDNTDLNYSKSKQCMLSHTQKLTSDREVHRASDFSATAMQSHTKFR